MTKFQLIGTVSYQVIHTLFSNHLKQENQGDILKPCASTCIMQSKLDANMDLALRIAMKNQL
jgi:hypothetical protein